MSHNGTITNKSFFQKIVFSIILFATTTSPLRATTGLNKYEIGAAIATMLVDIAANHYDFKKDASKANVLKSITDLLSLSTKSLYFYNNIQARHDTGGWNPLSKDYLNYRDCLVNSALMTRDVTKLAEHLQASLGQKNANTPDIRALIAANPRYKNLTQEQLNTIEKATYNYKVFILPLFKGLTAMAMAATQRYATPLHSDQHRFTATALHCLAQLLEEKNNLPANSKLTKPLIVALWLNVVWAAAEGLISVAEQSGVDHLTGTSHTVGNTTYTTTYYIPCRSIGSRQPAIQFRCGHACCMHCLRNKLHTDFDKNDTAQFHNLSCAQGCPHPISRDAIRNVTFNDPDIMHAYDVAAFNDALPELEQLFPGNQTMYEILGLAPSASAEDIKRAYRQRSLENHPDKNSANINTTEIFQRISNANDMLSDEDKRAEYDDALRELRIPASRLQAPTTVLPSSRATSPTKNSINIVTEPITPTSTTNNAPTSPAFEDID